MKLLKFLCLAVAIVSLTACSDDDNAPAPFELTNANVAGTYEVVFFEGVDVETNVTGSGSTITVERETFTTDTFTNAVFTFNSNGTYTSSGSFRITRVLTVTGQSPETEITIEQFEGEGTYLANTSSNTITFNGDEINNVTLFNETNLRITNTDVDTLSNGNTETETIEIRLVRQN